MIIFILLTHLRSINNYFYIKFKRKLVQVQVHYFIIIDVL